MATIHTATAVPSAARTTGGNTGPLSSLTDTLALRAHLIVTAATSTGTTPDATLDVALDESLDGGTTWVEVAAFPRMTAAGVAALSHDGLRAPLVRFRWAVGGTGPSVTFAVHAAAVGAD